MGTRRRSSVSCAQRAVALAFISLSACASDDSGTDSEALRTLPATETLCKVFRGHDPMDTMHERKTYGTHAPDVLGVWGAPEEMADGEWTYEWRKTDGATVSVVVTFESANLCQRSGAKVTPGQYVTDIEATGVSFQKCWDPALNNEKPDCPECLNTVVLVQCSP